MYRDIIGKPEQKECNGKRWWVQIFHKADGSISEINLYDIEGNYVGEFHSLTDLENYIEGAQ